MPDGEASRPTGRRTCGRPAAAALLAALLVGCGGPARQETEDPGDGLTAEQRRVKERLEAIGYATGTEPAPAESGVTVHRPELTAPGLNLFTSGHAPAAVLVDMDGTEIHEWRYQFRDIWPDKKISRRNRNWQTWRFAHLLEGGELLAIFEGFGLIKLDRDSNLVWASEERAHHDIDVLPDGDIYTLTRKAHILPRINPDKPVLEDFITVLGPDGRTKESFSLLEAWERSELRAELDEKLVPNGDLFHANTLEYFDGSKAHLSPLYARGNVLTSFRRLDTIAIVDTRKREIIWTMSGDWGGQHYPTLLDDGRILLFVNRHPTEVSTVAIIDPTDQSVDWIYRGSPPESFYTSRCGGAQMLANGNVLITESQDGRVFEVDREGEIVWEWFNPHRLRRGTKIAYVYLLTRYPRELFDPSPDGRRPAG